MTSLSALREYIDPCRPSPCGANAQCTEQNQVAVCSCLPTFVGTPPLCRPECVSNSECSLDRACINQKCEDPCPGTCGLQSVCHVRIHNPLCSCQPGYTGDASIRCYPIPPPPVPAREPYNDPCIPSPCGQYANCRVVNEQAICSCLPSYVGIPPQCRPECIVSSDCPSHLACLNQRCQDPCPGSCGLNALCSVQNHVPICNCQTGYIGNPFDICQPVPTFVPSKPNNKLQSFAQLTIKHS